MSRQIGIADVRELTSCGKRPSNGVNAVDLDGTRRGRKKRRQKLQQRRPSAAVWPNDADALPLSDLKIHACKSDGRPEAFLKSCGANHARHFKWATTSVSPSTRTG